MAGGGQQKKQAPNSFLPINWKKIKGRGPVLFIRQLGKGRVYNLNSLSASPFLGLREENWARVTWGQEQLSPHYCFEVGPFIERSVCVCWGHGGYAISLSVQSKRKKKKKEKKNPKNQSPPTKGFSLGPQLNQMPPDPRRKPLPPATSPGGTHQEIALGDCLESLLVLLISVHLSCLNSCYTNLAQCIKIPIENNENSVSK